MLAALILAAATPSAPAPVRAVAIVRARIVSAPRLNLSQPKPVTGAQIGKTTIDFE